MHVPFYRNEFPPEQFATHKYDEELAIYLFTVEFVQDDKQLFELFTNS